MRYRVLVTLQAKANLMAYYEYSAKRTPEAAARWLDRFEEALESLAEHPERCGRAAESDAVGMLIRHMLFGRGRNVYRALFIVTDLDVTILHIRRGLMDQASPEDLFGDG